jgi:hypothetical protein
MTGLKSWLLGLAQIAAGALLLCGILLGVSAYERSKAIEREVATRRPSIYLISVSRISLYEGDEWLVSYAVDGIAQSTTFTTKKDPEEFIAYLAKVGTLEGRE